MTNIIPPEMIAGMIRQMQGLILDQLKAAGPPAYFRGAYRDAGYDDASIDAIWSGVLTHAKDVPLPPPTAEELNAALSG